MFIYIYTKNGAHYQLCKLLKKNKWEIWVVEREVEMGIEKRGKWGGENRNLIIIGSLKLHLQDITPCIY